MVRWAWPTKSTWSLIPKLCIYISKKWKLEGVATRSYPPPPPTPMYSVWNDRVCDIVVLVRLYTYRFTVTSKTTLLIKFVHSLLHIKTWIIHVNFIKQIPLNLKLKQSALTDKCACLQNENERNVDFTTYKCFFFTILCSMT